MQTVWEVNDVGGIPRFFPLVQQTDADGTTAEVNLQTQTVMTA